MHNSSLPGFINGKIKMLIKDGFSDLFFSECKDKGIILKDVMTNENGYIFEVSKAASEKIADVAANCGMDSAIISSRGLPAIFGRYRKRLGIITGIILSVAVLFILSSSVWSIDIAGNDVVSDRDITELLNENGVKKGVFAKTILTDDVEFMIEKAFPEVSWVTASVTGSRLLIEIKERTEDKTENREGIYTNIVASKDGEIISADIFKGEGKLRPGEAVVKGDLLVSGVITYKDGRVKLTDSEAEIMARTKNTVVSHIADNLTVEVITECKDKYLPVFFGAGEGDDTPDKENHFTSNAFFLCADDIVFPVGFIRENEITTEKRQISPDSGELLLIVFSDFAKASAELYKSAQITDREIMINFDGQISVEAIHRCIENIAEKREIFFEEYHS